VCNNPTSKNLRIAVLVPRHGDPVRTDHVRRLQMSYPADVAHPHKTSRAGEAEMEKAVTHVTSGEGTGSLSVLGELLTYKIPSQQTGGAYALFEVTTRPEAGPPPHVQHREDESFYVLEGDYEFLVDSNTTRAGAGSLLYVPKGTLHSHKNVGEGVGRMLMSQTPGGLYERFFEKVGIPVDMEAGPLAFEDQPEMRRIVEVAAKYGIEIPPPVAHSRTRAEAKKHD
jgi:mannose-6-phosphate isomerase-like protein (cupin superfamily)